MQINLDPLVQVNRQVGFIKGRVALRRELSEFITSKFAEATDEEKAIYQAIRQFLIESFDKDNYEETA